MLERLHFQSRLFVGEEDQQGEAFLNNSALKSKEGESNF